MVISLDLQLRVVLKALREVVGPAVDPANQLAAEQLALSIMTLAMVQSRLPYIHAGSRQELSNAVTLATAVVNAAETTKLHDQIATAQALLENPGSTLTDLENTRSKLLNAISSLVKETQDPVRRAAVSAAVIAASMPQFDLARAWSLPAGFELDPVEIRALEALL